MRRIFLTLSILFTALAAWAQHADTTLVPRGQVKPEKDSIALPPAPEWDMEVTFASRDTCSLSMDIYFPKDDNEKHPCVLFVYGGGFVQNNLRARSNRIFCRQMADAGYVTCAVDYRLGLKGVKASSPLSMVDNMDIAVHMATEDLFSAVKYVLDYADELTVDPSKIITIGSSAGAITVLQADYELCNRTPQTAELPEDFRFAGVVSLSGAVFSREGKCDYRVHDPAPTMFLHGTKDRLVTYKQIRLFRLGFFGTDKMVDRFDQFDYPYFCLRFNGRAHEVATFASVCLDQILWFIDRYVNQGKKWQVDAFLNELEMDPKTVWDFDVKALYGK